MNRRKFLGAAAVGALGLAGCSGAQTLPGPPGEPSGRRSKKVVVLGAGLAGLAAGHELLRSGHDVTVVEARARPGGRVLTLREPFSDGLRAEAGALFVPNSHQLTLQYIRRFNLAVDLALPMLDARLYYVRGRRVVANLDPAVDWPFDVTPRERTLGRRGMWAEYLQGGLEGLGDITAPAGPATPRLEALDRMSGSDFLRSRGASSAAVDLLRVGPLDLVGDGLDSYSALQMLQRLALLRAETVRFAVRGGTDLLTRALADGLAGRIRYDAPVVRIEPGERSARVVTGGHGQYHSLSADHVVCTIPFSVLRRIDVSPSFSPPKTRTLEQLAYTSVVRIYLQFRERRWRRENLFVTAATDLPIKWVFEHTVNQPGPRGILEAQAVGPEARRLGAMSEDDRIAFALAQIEEVFPGVRQDFERGTSKSWDDDPWARGAFAYWRPGQMLALAPHVARPEGRVHFAGDHTSAWSGWMQGALESGLRAAREIAEVV